MSHKYHRNESVQRFCISVFVNERNMSGPSLPKYFPVLDLTYGFVFSEWYSNKNDWRNGVSIVIFPIVFIVHIHNIT